MTPIGILESPFREKFGTPRQPQLVRSAVARLRLGPEYRDAVRGLEAFSHVWLIFGFHLSAAEGWRPLVRPPRLGGQRSVGVFATRSPHRPNPVGLSAVRLLSVEPTDEGGVELRFSGADLVDGTPVFDIKPYVPYADVIDDASAAWTDAPLPDVEVTFGEAASLTLRAEAPAGEDLESLIVECLRLDPRPAFHREEHRKDGAPKDKTYAVRLSRYDVHWTYTPGRCEVTRIDVVEE